MTVFISIADMDTVMVARKYQADAYNDFMNDKDRPSSKEFRFKSESERTAGQGTVLKQGKDKHDDATDIVFKIVTFDTEGLSQKYPSFCTLVNEYGERYALSNDKNALLAFHVFRQRLLSVY